VKDFSLVFWTFDGYPKREKLRSRRFPLPKRREMIERETYRSIMVVLVGQGIPGWNLNLG